MPSLSIRHNNNGSTIPSCFAISTFNIRGLSSTTNYTSTFAVCRRRNALAVLTNSQATIGSLACCHNHGTVAMHLENRIIRHWAMSGRITVIQTRLTNNSLLVIINMYGLDVAMCQKQQCRTRRVLINNIFTYFTVSLPFSSQDIYSFEPSSRMNIFTHKSSSTLNLHV